MTRLRPPRVMRSVRRCATPVIAGSLTPCGLLMTAVLIGVKVADVRLRKQVPRSVLEHGRGCLDL